ncbi:LysR family transcriptional regulator [Pseudoduganella violacea]|uniref:DNA-binding transcriptional LysR family regulator n=1 Tax=Pseudoduganella violacea TaxID=1715466 RepID=A0A7W5FTH3_9BURK|nr:LysR family transcriptional regulator [Pseudoduganella violacea]MBB3118642.1 DNA-binding transcriptional LysR family regulator [Pseudoduganella violacea]
MVSLDRFAVFRAVVEDGSFTAAAARLKQARAAVSFNIKQLERELGVTLLSRTTRRVALTDAGERFYARCIRVEEEAQAAIDEARREHDALDGELRITSTVEYALEVVAPALHAFTAQHRALQVRLETHTAHADLLRDRVDVAIRLGRQEHFEALPYRGALLATFEIRPVIAPSLLASSGVQGKRTPTDLASLPWLGHAQLEHIKSWNATDSHSQTHVLHLQDPQIVTDNASVLLHLARQGSGLSLLPEWLVRRDLESGMLVDALPGYHFPTQAVYALYAPGSHVPRKVRAWIDFMKDYLAQPR